MPQAPKKKPKRAPEPLDWKELASGPALRGLSEVLATPAEAAKERAARRLALDASAVDDFPAPTPPVDEAVAMTAVSPIVETPTVVDSYTEGIRPTEGVEVAKVDVIGLMGGGSGVVSGQTETPTDMETPTVGDIPGVVEIRGEVCSETPTADDTASVGEIATEADSDVTPTVGDLVTDTANVSQPIEAKGVEATAKTPGSPTVGDKTTALVAPTVGVLSERYGVVAWKSEGTAIGADGGETPTVGYSRSAGVSEWIDAQGAIYVSRKVMRVQIAQHCLTLGEERFYQEVWHAREADGVRRDGPRSKVFSMGYDRLAKLVRLDEKSVRQLIPKLVAKRVLEVLAGEDSSARIGRTYRIFSYEEILERQRAENMHFVIKKGRAVVFVWPLSERRQLRVRTATAGGSIPTEGVRPAVGDWHPADFKPVISSLAAPVGADSADGEASPVEQALNYYVRADGDAVRMMIAGARRYAPNATIEEIVYFIHDKGRQARAGKIANPLAYLLVYVPKCFEGESFLRFREEVRRAREVEEDAGRQAREELAQLRTQWQAWLSDPAVREEDKVWARRMLASG